MGTALKLFLQQLARNPKVQAFVAKYGDDALTFLKGHIRQVNKLAKIAKDPAKYYGRLAGRKINSWVDSVQNVGTNMATNYNTRQYQRLLDRFEQRPRAQYNGFDIAVPGGPGTSYPLRGFLNKARATSAITLSEFLVPTARTSATLGSFIRGAAGETVSRLVARILEVLVLGPRGVLSTPKARVFVKAIVREIKSLRQMGDITSAKKLWNALNLALKEASTIYGQPAGLGKYQLGGYVLGRTAAAGTITFGGWEPLDKLMGTDGQANRQEFKESVGAFLRQNQYRVYIPGYTKSDGTRVKGHYRTVNVRPNASTASVQRVKRLSDHRRAQRRSIANA